MLSKRCVICKKPGEIVELYEGLYDDEMVMVCLECANEENIPILRKPTKDQLIEVDKRYSVRERMERISGMHRHRTELSGEQQTVQRNLNRLRAPEPKEQNPDVVDNYYWELNMARRRKKITINQLAVQTKIPIEVLEAIEKGKIPVNFEQIFVILEDYFGIKLLKHHKARVNYHMPKEEEEKILEEVKQRLEERKEKEEKEEFEESGYKHKENRLKDLEEGRLKISDYKNLDNITLSDLAQLKKQKEEKERIDRVRKQTEDLLGDDIDFS